MALSGGIERDMIIHRAIKKKRLPAIAVESMGFAPIVILVRKEETANKARTARITAYEEVPIWQSD